MSADLERDDYVFSIRNRLIAEAFYLTGDIERYGTGFVRIREFLKDYPELALSVSEVGDFLKVELRAQDQPADVPVSAPVSVPENVPVGERQKWFLEQLQAGVNCKASDLAEKWKVTEKTAKRDIADLKKKNLIKFTGPPKTGRYLIQSEK
jgi:ATP-dependent DNA helicase RecG